MLRSALLGCLYDLLNLIFQFLTYSFVSKFLFFYSLFTFVKAAETATCLRNDD